MNTKEFNSGEASLSVDLSEARQAVKENRFKDSISGRTNFSANKTDLVIYDAEKKKEVKRRKDKVQKRKK